jgi:PAS domain S-box-containing protein
VFGVFLIYSAETNAFTLGEIRLLEELAGDLAFGITVLRTRIERKKVEEALRKNEKDLKEAQRLAQIGSWEWDATTDTITWSEEYYHIFGFDPTRQPPGYAEHLKAYTPESATRLDVSVKRNMQYGEPYEIDLEIAGSEEPRRWITARSETVHDAQGKITGLRGTVQDITERKRAEMEQARLATVIEQTSETIVITDLNGTILYVNPAFEKITGYTRQEAMGQNPRILQSRQHTAAFYSAMWDTLKRGKVWHGHFINKRKDGTLYEEDAIISPIRDTLGAVVSFVAIKRDVTREVQLELEVRQAQKMEAVGRLAGGVAHDFNNILQAILGFCEITLDDMGPQDMHRQGLIEIEKASRRAADLTRQLLAFSRRQLIVPAMLDLNTLIFNLKKMLCRLIGEDIQLNISLAPNLKFIKADAGQIEQVIMNLVVNARDAMPQGGQITISTTPVTFTTEDLSAASDGRPGEFISIAVTDSGTGMTNEVLAHIFEPFFTTKGPGKGTGLGLAVIHGIVKQHNGWIHVASQVGQGSTFTVYLPVCFSPEQAASDTLDERTPPTKGYGERILVVEDEAEVRNLTARVLRKAGYEVAVAKNAHHAWQTFEQAQHPFDLIISDVVLPDQSGIELVEQLLGKAPHLDVLLCSGYTDERSHWNTIENRGFHFLQKPYPLAALLRSVRQILDVHTTPT